jgi:NAD(P)-dependent dehydrogenase (short-subunit alcohol dehydrogenase family)
MPTAAYRNQVVWITGASSGVGEGLAHAFAEAGARVVVSARRSDELDPQRPVVVYCASGQRSSVAASWLRSHGFADVSDVIGGYQAVSLLTRA